MTIQTYYGYDPRRDAYTLTATFKNQLGEASRVDFEMPTGALIDYAEGDELTFTLRRTLLDNHYREIFYHPSFDKPHPGGWKAYALERYRPYHPDKDDMPDDEFLAFVDSLDPEWPRTKFWESQYEWMTEYWDRYERALAKFPNDFDPDLLHHQLELPLELT